MITASLPVRAILTAGILSIAFTSAAHAGTFAQTIVGVGDDATGYGDIQEQESAIFELVSVAGEYAEDFDLGPVGGNGFLSFSGEATAWAQLQPLGQYLGTSGTSTVTNTFYDPDYNYDAGTGFVPTVYGSQAIASFTETLQYLSTATAYTSTYYFHLTGINAGEGVRTTVKLIHGGQAPQFWDFYEAGAVDLVIKSQAWVHGLSPQTITLELLTQVDHRMEGLSEGDTISGSSNFGSTLELLGVELRDQDGELLPDGTITSESGSHFTVVPEPTVSVLFGLAAAGLGLRRRR